jgi:hypothetical protein
VKNHQRPRAIPLAETRSRALSADVARENFHHQQPKENTMNIETNDNGPDEYIDDPLIDIIAECLGDDCGINVDQNCSIGEMAELLAEIETHFDGDTASALAAIRAGDLKFEEIHEPEGWAWHIKATRQ